jgi:hypothetical protein
MKPMSSSVLDRAVGRVGRKRINRRSMLRRTTMAATAMAVAPTDFLLRPSSAYAAVCRCQGQNCGCGSQCCDAYTEFCCTLTGQNGCPPGTVAAGWWKVDGSGFCGGAPRYYLDCNAQCGGCGCGGGICSGACSGTHCGCALGDCNNRKSGCVQFRYGQCNQHIACLGPIVCRVVTCTPPWVFDGSCTTSSRTDNATANHSRPCLERPFGGFDNLVDIGGAIHVLGWAVDQNNRDAVEARVFIDQLPMVSAIANVPRPDVGAAYPYYGDRHGFDMIIPCMSGRHVVCVLAYDQGSRESTFLAFGTIQMSGPVGNVEFTVANGGQLTVGGWMVDPLAPATPARVRLWMDGVIAGETITNLPRPDVVAAFPGHGPNSGYEITVPVTSGPRAICVDMVYDSGLTNRFRCLEVTVP